MRRTEGGEEVVVIAAYFIGFSVFFALFFESALFSGALMTSGDGLVQGVPTFFGRHPLWEPNMMLGYPLFADPNQAYWYPLLRILRSIPAGFNIYAVAPYVIGATGMAAFARSLSGSSAGGIVAGLTFGLSGFMIAHQGHLNLIHPAAWTPYILWSFEALRRGKGWSALLSGSLAIALSATSGSQQALVYVVFVGIAYAIVFAPRPPLERTRFLVACGATIGLGIGLAAIALVPTIEFSLRSLRADETYADYIAFSVGLTELPVRLFFPYFFGAPAASPVYPYSVANLGAFAEASNYAGISTLVLAGVTVLCYPDRRQVAFWCAVALVALWLSLGDALLATRIAYHLPVYNLFRIPARHALEFTLAVAVLASFGVSTLERSLVRWRDAWIAVGLTLFVFALTLAAVARYGNDVRASVAVAGTPAVPVPLLPFQNSALGMPVVVVTLSSLAVLVALLLRERRAAVALVGFAVVCDLTSFAGFSYWRYFSVAPASLALRPAVQAIRLDLSAHRQRMYAVPGSQIATAVPPNLSAFWELPSLSGYVSLEDRLVATGFDMQPAGEIPLVRLGGYGNAMLDIASVRYVAFPKPADAPVPVASEFDGPSLETFIGSDALTPDKTAVFEPSKPVRATALDVTSALGQSMSIPNGAVVATIDVTDRFNRTTIFSLLAGRDTAESAYDRPDVTPLMRHARATIFAGNAEAHIYSSRFHIRTTEPIVRLTVRWRYADPAVGALTITHLALVDESAKSAYRFSVLSPFYGNRSHWQAIENVAFGNDLVFRNRQALRDAWLVVRSERLSASAQLTALRHAAPAVWDAGASPATLGLVEGDELSPHADAAKAPARILASTATPTTASYRVDCPQRCLLIASGLWYPGWKASVDGVPAPVHRVDYLLRGIDVAPGSHLVASWFAPGSLALGIAITLASALTLALLPFTSRYLRIAPRYEPLSSYNERAE